MDNIQLENLFISALRADQTLHLRDILLLKPLFTELQGELLILEESRISMIEGGIQVMGKMQIFHSSASVQVRLTAKMVNGQEDQVRLSLEGTLPADWKMAASFGPLPPSYRASKAYRGALVYGESIFNDLALEACRFVVTNYADPDNNLKSGINFKAQLLVSQALAPFEKLFRISESLALNGIVRLPKDNVPTRIELRADIAAQSLTLMHFTARPLYLTLFTDYPEFEALPESKAALISRVTIEGNPPLDFLIEATMSELDDAWSFRYLPAEAPVTIGKGFNALSGIAGLPIEFELPEGFNFLNELHLNKLVLTLNPFINEVNSLLLEVGFGASRTENWILIKDLVEIAGPAVGLRILSPRDPDFCIISPYLTGTFVMGKEKPVHLDVKAEYYDGFRVMASLREGDLINLRDAAAGLIPVSNLPDLNVDELFFTAGSGGDLSIAGDIRENWFIPSSEAPLVVIENTSFLLKRNNRRVSGSFTGYLSILNVQLNLTASQAPDSGWQFSGETRAGQQIPIGSLVQNLGSRFGKFIVPAPVAGLTVENLALSFNSRNKDFSFSIEALLPLTAGSTDAVDLTLTIDLKNQRGGAYSKSFAGLLRLKGLEFDVLFDAQRQVSAVGEQAPPSDSRAFLALFRNTQGLRVPVDELLKPLGLNIESGLSFTIKEALLAYQKTSGSADPDAGIPNVSNGKWLFGIDIDGGLNLSAIHIDDLPFVSIPPDQKLALDFQVLIASQPFTQPEIQALSALAPGGNLGFPDKPVEKIDLSVTLDLGTARKQIDLPIGLKTQAGAGAGGQQPANNGLVPAEQANASTPQSGSGVAVAGQDGVRWIPLQKQLGPLAFERIGVKYGDNRIQALLDAAFSAGGLTIALNGLSVSSPVSEFKPVFGLNGLGIDFKNTAVEIGGTFLKEAGGFAGLALIRTEALSLSAIGAYTYANGAPSLFLYAVLNYPFGGPAFFYVTGIAAGFGYNRRLLMPDIGQVAAFPLVAEATRDSAQDANPKGLPSDQQGRALTLQREIQALDQYIPIDPGQYFLAVGLKFTSFKQIDSFALLALQFGNRFEIDLLGLSTLKVPTPAEGGTIVTPVAEAQLALKAVFIPSEGFLGVRAQLTSNSYILSRACRLTGGFAFYSWFDGPHDGDFVLTLGGYHPSFRVPDHYPQVPRLGFNWRVSDQFFLSGELYFALTAHALMAGGRLDALFQTDTIKAWFRAGADFLIAWKPYHYEVSVFVSMGLDITFDFFGTHTISLSAGADLKLWGPEFGGEAHIRVKVLFFTVPVDLAFGSRAPAVPAIGFAEFKQSYLPSDGSQVCSVAIRSGLIGTVTENGEEIWIVDPKEMVLVTNSVIPGNRSNLMGHEHAWDGAAIAIQPMAVQPDELIATHEILLSGTSNPDPDLFKFTPVAKKMPAALWGKPEVLQNEPFRHVGNQRYVEKPQLNGERFVEDALAGYEIRIGQAPLPGTTHAVDKKALGSTLETAPTQAAWERFELSQAPVGAAAWQAAAAAASGQDIARDELLAFLGYGQTEVDFGEPVMENVAV